MWTRRFALAVLVVAGLSLAVSTSSLAVKGAVSTTTIIHADTQTLSLVLPCIPGDPVYDVSFTYNQVKHRTTLPDGSVHLATTETATFVATPSVDDSLPVYSGRYTWRSGRNVNAEAGNLSRTLTYTLKATGDDGSQIDFHVTQHVSLSATGVTSEVLNVSC